MRLQHGGHDLPGAAGLRLHGALAAAYVREGASAGETFGPAGFSPRARA